MVDLLKTILYNRYCKQLKGGNKNGTFKIN